MAKQQARTKKKNSINMHVKIVWSVTNPCDEQAQMERHLEKCADGLFTLHIMLQGQTSIRKQC